MHVKKVSYVFFLLLLWYGPHQNKLCANRLSCVSQHFITAESKEAFFDKKKKKFLWKGDVRIQHTEGFLTANEASYCLKTNVFSANKNVVFHHKNTVFHADKVTLEKDLTLLTATGLRIITNDHIRMTAPTGRHDSSARKLTIINGSYTPCFADKKKHPLWHIRARRVERDNKENTVTYIDPQFFLGSVPVFYLPYLQYSTVRASGFLTPQYGTSTSWGLFASTPYFWALPYTNITLAPFVTSKRGALGYLTMLHNTSAGNITGDGSIEITKPQSYETNGITKKTDNLRGHVFLKWKHDIDPNWRIHFDGNAVTDPTYLRSLDGLGIAGDKTSLPFLQSNLRVERFSKWQHLSITASNYYPFKNNLHHLLAGPYIDYTWSSPLSNNNISYDMMMHASHIHDELDGPYDRCIGQGKISWHTYTPYGQAIFIKGLLRGDFFNLTSRTAIKEAPDVQARFFPQLFLKTSYPLGLEKLPITINPFLIGILAPNLSQEQFPADDSKGFELHDNNFTLLKRLPGYDQIDDGTRIVYGFKTRMLIDESLISEVLLGQSYECHSPNPFLQQDGLKKGFSSFLGKVHLSLLSSIQLSYRTRLERKTLLPLFQEAALLLKTAPVIFNVAYNHWKDPQCTQQKRPSKKMLNTSADIRFGKLYTMRFVGDYDFIAKNIRQIGGEFIYQNDCMRFSMRLHHTNFHDKDVKPNTVFSFTLGLKQLGETRFSSKQNAFSFEETKPS